jgi:uncharacterized protein YecT (DUF1311 family)
MDRDRYLAACSVLEVTEDATLAEIRTAYRDLAKVWHPDRFGSNDERLRKKAENRLKAINDAYDYLRMHLPSESEQKDRSPSNAERSQRPAHTEPPPKNTEPPPPQKPRTTSGPSSADAPAVHQNTNLLLRLAIFWGIVLVAAIAILPLFHRKVDPRSPSLSSEQSPESPAKLENADQSAEPTTEAQVQSREQAAPVGPSFDCARAAYPSERLVCSSKELASLDLEMASAYHDALARLETKERMVALRNSQNHWLRRDRESCGNVSCLVDIYVERIRHLQTM